MDSVIEQIKNMIAEFLVNSKLLRKRQVIVVTEPVIEYLKTTYNFNHRFTSVQSRFIKKYKLRPYFSYHTNRGKVRLSDLSIRIMPRKVTFIQKRINRLRTISSPSIAIKFLKDRPMVTNSDSLNSLINFNQNLLVPNQQ